ncbi:MAG: carboxymuconolactone decarboxylase family protein [Prevotella sp.]|nr:carboxymuconolactone decarboxylase family protein [Prevotella sp.]
MVVAMLLTVNTSLNAQTMALSARQQGLSTIAAWEAKGNMAQLGKAIDEALDNGLTVAEIKEALSQLYAYTGFPRSLNALGKLQTVIAERQKAGKETPLGQDDSTVLPPGFDALKTGTEVQTQLSGSPFDYAFAPRTDYYLKAHLFGDIFSGKALSFADREIVTVSAIAALPGCEPQLLAHCRGALNMGVKVDELESIPQVLETRVGMAEASRTSEAIAQVLNKPLPKALQPKKGIEDSPWPTGDPNDAYAQYFVGQSYLAALDGENGGPHNVTFEPGCRNYWHIHHKLVQVLVCVAGRGWYQEWGKPAVELTPGKVIAIPAETKHWHGAADDSWMQHLAYNTRVEEGASTEWGTPPPPSSTGEGDDLLP